MQVEIRENIETNIAFRRIKAGFLKDMTEPNKGKEKRENPRNRGDYARKLRKKGESKEERRR